MSQDPISVANQSFPAFRSAMNNAFATLASTSIGGSRPADIVAGRVWIDNTSPSGTLWTYYLYDGTEDVAIGLIDSVNHLFIPLLNPFAGLATGTANAITLTLSPAPAPVAYYAGVLYTFIAASTNTGAVTVDIDSLGAKDVTKYGAEPLSGGEIKAGQVVILQYDGTQFQLQNSYPNVAFGECRLIKDGSDLKLLPYRGRFLTIGGLPYAVPSSGITLSASGASSSTLYYIYAYMNSGTMTLERSATGYTTDTATGILVKNGDTTRTYVGMARTTSGSAWADTAAQRFVASWYNPLQVEASAAYTADRSTSSTSFTELNTEIRVEFVTHARSIMCALNAVASNSSGSGVGQFTNLTLDGTSTVVAGAAFSSPSANYTVNQTVTRAYTFTEGYHYLTLSGRVASGTGTWLGATADYAARISANLMQ